MEQLENNINTILYNQEISEKARKEYKSKLKIIIKNTSKEILQEYVNTHLVEVKKLNNNLLNKYIQQII